MIGHVVVVIVVGIPLLLMLLTFGGIEPGAYDPQEYVAEWRRKRGLE